MVKNTIQVKKEITLNVNSRVKDQQKLEYGKEIALAILAYVLVNVIKITRLMNI